MLQPFIYLFLILALCALQLGAQAPPFSANKPPAELLGSNLPGSLTAHIIESLLIPPGKPVSPTFVAAKSVPGHSNLYFGIVCTGGVTGLGPDDQECTQFHRPDSTFEAYVGLINAPTGTAPSLTARPVAIDPMVNWQGTSTPDSPDALQDSSPGNVTPDHFDALDLSSYRISPEQPVFGVRGSWSDMHTGGYNSYSSLYLFAVVDGSLRQILTTPMTREDHTRVLQVTQHLTNDHFDLLLKSPAGHWNQLFRWSPASNRYQAAPKLPAQ